MTELLGSLGEMAVDEGEAAMWKKRALESEAAVLRLQKRVAELESENDLLALANADLRGGGGGGGGGDDDDDDDNDDSQLRVNLPCLS